MVCFYVFRCNPSSSQTQSSDGNRQRLLDAGIINPLLSVLQGYARGTDSLSAILHLRVAKTLIGVLLNLSLGYRKWLTTALVDLFLLLFL